MFLKFSIGFSFIFFYLSIALTSENLEDKVWISVGEDTKSFIQKTFGTRAFVDLSFEGITLLEIDKGALPWLSRLIHQEFSRCGGFIVHDNYSDGLLTLNSSQKRWHGKQGLFHDYQINNEKLVWDGIELIQEKRIRHFIEDFSSFHNRYYTSDSGVEALEWLNNKWSEMTAHRNDIEVDLWQHSSWPQPSVVLRISGKERISQASQRKIIVGGHADSIAGFFRRPSQRAPGADDNASGIGTMTEIIKVLMELNYQPENEILFMAYAAEEVGLRGSREIAKEMASNNADIMGVLQLDMTNFQGSDWDVVLINDYTNDQQNQFLGALLDFYQPDILWGYDSCGYACSDHASWHLEGYPASMPFQARMRESNPHIHSSRDLIDKSGGNADHAVKFARLGLSFVLELDN